MTEYRPIGARRLRKASILPSRMTKGKTAVHKVTAKNHKIGVFRINAAHELCPYRRPQRVPKCRSEAKTIRMDRVKGLYVRRVIRRTWG